MAAQEYWKLCSRCKKPIAFNTKYFVCSVSTCNGVRTGYVFCSVFCWEVHVPEAQHRNAGAVEKISPKAADVEVASAAPVRRIVASAVAGSGSDKVVQKNNAPKDILIVASKLKDYIRAMSDMNTSADVMDRLSEIVRIKCDRAIENARADGRKTVMARDFQ